MFEDNDAYDEIMEEYNEIPLEDRPNKAKYLAQALWNIGISDDEVYDLVSNWKRNIKPEYNSEEEWDPESERMRRYGARNKRELDEWEETNNPFSE